ncbi:MAG: hypothetical protein JW716_04385 [Candidatus Aenigmarchaeota archaeon]|nr:hypothetical protein [Candidatus Aenigmarchaeota archaeon]
MGFFDVFRKREEEKTPELTEEETTFEGIMEAVQSKLADGIENSMKEIEKINDNIEAQLKEVKKAAEKMRDTYFEKTDKTYTRINMVKDAWLKKFIASVDSQRKLAETTIDSINEYTKNMTEFIGGANTTNLRQNYILSNYFKDSMKNIVSSMGEINKQLASLRELTKEKSALRIRGDVNKMINDINRKIKDSEECLVNVGKMKKELKHLDEMEAEREKNLSDLAEGTEMQRLLSLEKNIAETEKEAISIKMNLSEELSTMNRPLKKIKHGSEAGEARVISEFLGSPVDVCLSDGGENKVENVIRIVAKHEKDKEVGLAEKDAKKIASFAEKIKSGEVRKIKDKYIKMLKSLEEMKKEIKAIETVRKRKSSIETDIETMKSEKEKVGKELKRNGEEAENLKKEIKELKKKLVSYIEENLYVRYKISD